MLGLYCLRSPRLYMTCFQVSNAAVSSICKYFIKQSILFKVYKTMQSTTKVESRLLLTLISNVILCLKLYQTLYHVAYLFIEFHHPVQNCDSFVFQAGPLMYM